MRENPIIAINTIAFHGYDLAVAFEAIAELGVRYVEPLLISRYNRELTENYFSRGNAEKLRKEISEYGLEVVALAAHMDLGQPGAYERFRRRMEFAGTLGAGIIHTNAAPECRKKEFLDTIEKLIPLAESLGLLIALENPGDGSGNLAGNGKEASALVKLIDSRSVRLNYDAANAYSYSDGNIDIEKDFAAALPYTAHLHLKQIRVDDTGQWLFSGIENGVIDYCKLFTSCKNQIAALPLSLELPLRFIRDNDRCVKPDLTRSRLEFSQLIKILSKSINYVYDLLTAEKPE